MAILKASFVLLFSTLALAHPYKDNLERTVNPHSTSSPAATKSGTLYAVAGVGSFSTLTTFNFAGLTALPSGLVVSNYTINDAAPYYHTFTPSNVKVSDGYLQLKVPGGQKTSPLSCAQVTTSFSIIKYASIRTTAIFGSSAGTVNGNFFYKTDCQEMDIEYITNATSGSNPGDGGKSMQYTNQATNCMPFDETHDTAPAPTDAQSKAHEYRIDWIAGKSMYYLDGVMQETFKTNVPTVAGSWIWNNWANGNPGWSGGPPTTDNIFKISSIVMYYNTSSS